MLSLVEHEKSFITLGPNLSLHWAHMSESTFFHVSNHLNEQCHVHQQFYLNSTGGSVVPVSWEKDPERGLKTVTFHP